MSLEKQPSWFVTGCQLALVAVLHSVVEAFKSLRFTPKNHFNHGDD